MKCSICGKDTKYTCGKCGEPVCDEHYRKYRFIVYHEECLYKSIVYQAFEDQLEEED
jgi:hypothetical protein